MRSGRIRGIRADAGFTLVEILIVIAIIAILASMITGATMYARDRANFAKAKSNISAIQTALEAYNTLTGVYPGAGHSGKAQDRPEELFTALYTGDVKIGGSRENHLADWPTQQIGKWDGSPKDFYEEPSDADLDFSSHRLTKCVFLDPWGREYHYVEFDSRAPGGDREAAGGPKAKGGQSYAIWSNGKDGKNDRGKNDDVNSWTEGGRATGGTGGTSGGGRR